MRTRKFEINKVEKKLSLKPPHFYTLAEFLKIEFKFVNDAKKFAKLFNDMLNRTVKNSKDVSVEQKSYDVTIRNIKKTGFVFYRNSNIAEIYSWNRIKVNLIYKKKNNDYVSIAVELKYDGKNL